LLQKGKKVTKHGALACKICNIKPFTNHLTIKVIISNGITLPNTLPNVEEIIKKSYLLVENLKNDI